MLRKGPIPRFVHGVIEYLAGVLLIASPFVLDFTEIGAATAVAVVMGVVVIVLAALSEGPPGLVDQVTLPAHAILDYVVAALLIASPFVFGFSEHREPTALLLVLGVAHLLVSIGTRYLPERLGLERRRAA